MGNLTFNKMNKLILPIFVIFFLVAFMPVAEANVITDLWDWFIGLFSSPLPEIIEEIKDIDPTTEVFISNEYNVKWYEIKNTGMYYEYIIAVQNLQDINRNFDLKTVMRDTSTSLDNIKDEHLFEFKNVTFTKTISVPYECNYLGNSSETIERTCYNNVEVEDSKIGWKEISNVDKEVKDNSKKKGFGTINIPKSSSELKATTAEGTKYFKYTFNVPYGTKGIVGFLIDGEEYHPPFELNSSTEKAYPLNIINSDPNNAHHDELITINLTELGVQCTFSDCADLQIVHDNTTPIKWEWHNNSVPAYPADPRLRILFDYNQSAGTTNEDITIYSNSSERFYTNITIIDFEEGFEDGACSRWVNSAGNPISASNCGLNTTVVLDGSYSMFGSSTNAPYFVPTNETAGEVHEVFTEKYLWRSTGTNVIVFLGASAYPSTWAGGELVGLLRYTNLDFYSHDQPTGYIDTGLNHVTGEWQRVNQQLDDDANADDRCWFNNTACGNNPFDARLSGSSSTNGGVGFIGHRQWSSSDHRGLTDNHKVSFNYPFRTYLTGIPATVTTDGEQSPPATTPLAPDLNEPLNNTFLSIITQFNWSNSTDPNDDALNYSIEISTDETFLTGTNYNNGSIIETDNTTEDVSVSLSGDGTYFWRVFTFAGGENSSASETRTFVLDTTTPLVYIDSPTNTTYGNFSVSFLKSVDDLTLDTQIYSTDNGVTNTTVTGNITITFSTTGNKHIIYSANDSFNKWNSTRIDFHIDSINPIVLLNESISNVVGDTYPLTINFNTSSSDPDNFLDTCYYDIDQSGINISYTCDASTNIDFNAYGVYNVTFCANDSVNNIACNLSDSFNIRLLNVTMFESSDTILEGDQLKLTLLVNLTPYYTNWENDFSTYLVWNFTEYGFGTDTKIANDLMEFNNTFTAPFGTGSSGGNKINGTWYYTLLNSLVDNKTISDTQTVFSIGVDNCTTFGNKTLTISIWDEDSVNTAITAEVEIEINYFTSNESNFQNYTTKLEGQNSYDICFSLNQTVKTNTYIKYTTAEGFTHRYYIVNETLDPDNVRNATMYNFENTTLLDISDLKITVRNKNTYQYFKNVITSLQRRYLSEGVYRVVQMDESGDFGSIFFNILEETTDYKLIFKDRSNNLLKQTEDLKFICTLGLCELTVLLEPYSASSASIPMTIAYQVNNVTNNLTLGWEASSGNDNTVRLLVKKETMTDTVTICDVTQTGISGNTSCDLSNYQGEVYVYVEANGDVEVSEWFGLNITNLGSFIGEQEGAIWTFIIILTTMMFGLFSPAGSVITGIIGLVIVFFLGIFTPLTLTFIIVAIILGILIGVKVRS